jgi:hypothetical protein
MTNFAFLMDLFGIRPKFFLALGFDHSMVSRWRSGRRRLMPRREPARTIAAALWGVDEGRGAPVLESILQSWYPAASCRGMTEKQALLERFLTEKGQADPAYQKIRDARLGRPLRYRDGAAGRPHGIEPVRLGMLDFLDMAAKLPEPVQVRLVFTEGQFPYLDDAQFHDRFMDKMAWLYEKGHRLMVAARHDRSVADSWYFHGIRARMNAHLKGYVHTYFYDSFQRQGSDKILGAAGSELAFCVTRDNQWDYSQSHIRLCYNTSDAADINTQIHQYFDRAWLPVHYDAFRNPGGLLGVVGGCQPCYLITRFPFFGVTTPDALVEAFALSNNEMELLQAEFHPFLLDPSCFSPDTPVRHIFCGSDIKAALMKKRHLSLELSTMLNRKVWMPKRALIQHLLKTKMLLKSCENYSACFLDSERFDSILMQAGLWGNEAAVCWADRHPAISCTDRQILAGMQSVCEHVWEDIPTALRDRRAAIRAIHQWVRSAGG